MMIRINELKRGFEQYQSEFEAKALKILRSGWYVLGTEVENFEREFAAYVGTSYCIGVDNGLNAISLGIRALDIGEGDEVIVAANTYIATALGVSHNGATPVFVDADDYHNINPYKIESAITSHTKAILITHLYGQPCQMDVIVNICKEHNLYLLEDCAQAHGALFDNKMVGSFGVLGFYSFYPTKNMGAFGDAGAIVTNDENLMMKLRTLRNYGSLKRYQNDYIGYNSRLDELQAGLLRIKLKHIDVIINERIKIARIFCSEINNKRVALPRVIDNVNHVFHLFVIMVDDREKFREHMKRRGVQTDVHYPTPPYLSKAYENLGYKSGDFPKTEELYSHIVTIPLFNGMTDEEINSIVKAVNDYEG